MNDFAAKYAFAFEDSDDDDDSSSDKFTPIDYASQQMSSSDQSQVIAWAAEDSAVNDFLITKNTSATLPILNFNQSQTNQHSAEEAQQEQSAQDQLNLQFSYQKVEYEEDDQLPQSMQQQQQEQVAYTFIEEGDQQNSDNFVLISQEQSESPQQLLNPNHDQSEEAKSGVIIEQPEYEEEERRLQENAEDIKYQVSFKDAEPYFEDKNDTNELLIDAQEDQAEQQYTQVIPQSAFEEDSIVSQSETQVNQVIPQSIVSSQQQSTYQQEQPPQIKQKTGGNPLNWLQSKDEKMSKFFQDLLSDSDSSEEEELIIPTSFNYQNPNQMQQNSQEVQPLLENNESQQQLEVDTQQFNNDQSQQEPAYQQQENVDFFTQQESQQELPQQQNQHEAYGENESHLFKQHLFHNEKFYQYQDSQKIEQVLVINYNQEDQQLQENEEDWNKSDKQVESQEIVNEVDENESSELTQQQSHMSQQQFDEFKLLHEYQHPVAQQHYNFEEEEKEEIQIQLKPFEQVFEISTVQENDGIKELPKQIQHQRDDKDIHSAQKQQQRPFHSNMIQSNSRMFVAKQNNNKVQIKFYSNSPSTVLIESLSEFVNVDPSRFNDNLKQKLVAGIENYIQKEKKLSESERDVWSLLQYAINLTPASARRTLPDFLQQDNYFLVGQRNLIIEMLCGGRQLSQFVEQMSDHRNQRQDQDNPNMLGQAFDNEKGVKYDGFVRELVKRDNWTDGLLIAALFCNQKDKSSFFGEYVHKFYKPSNPLYSLLMIVTDQDEVLLSNEQTMIEIMKNWRIQVGFLLKNIEFLPNKAKSIRRFVSQISHILLQKHQDIWGYVFLRLIIGDWQEQDLTLSNCNSLKLNLSINYLSSIIDILNPQGEQSKHHRVELAFYRSEIYSKVYNDHEKAHQELHYVIENRESLDPRIYKSQYFHFYMREKQQLEYDLSRGVKQMTAQVNSDQHQSSNQSSMKKVQSQSQENVFEQMMHQEINRMDHGQGQLGSTQNIITGFRGFFKKVIDQAQTIGQNLIAESNEDEIDLKKSDQYRSKEVSPTRDTPNGLGQNSVDRKTHSEQRLREQEFEQLGPQIQKQVNIEEVPIIVPEIQQLPQPQKQVFTQPPRAMPQRFPPPRMIRGPAPPRFTPVQIPKQQDAIQTLAQEINHQNLEQPQEQYIPTHQTQQQNNIVEQQKPDQVIDNYTLQGPSQQNPFGMVPRNFGQQNAPRPRGRGRIMYASLLHHDEDSQPKANFSVNKPPE